MIVPSKKPGSTKELLSVFLLYLTGLFIVGLSVFALDVKGGFSVGVFNRFVRGENAKETTEYYAYDDDTALSIDSNDGYETVSVINHIDSALPIVPFGVCGTRSLAGGITHPQQSDHLFYSEVPFFDETTFEWDPNQNTYNVLDAQSNELQGGLTPKDWNASYGLPINESDLVTAETVRNYPRIYSIEKETCVVMNMAFIVLYILLLPPYLFLVWKDRAW